MEKAEKDNLEFLINMFVSFEDYLSSITAMELNKIDVEPETIVHRRGLLWISSGRLAQYELYLQGFYSHYKSRTDEALSYYT